MKLLHSADWQIGLKAKHVARAADRVRAARLDAARAVIDAANREQVDCVVLAGDLFEDNRVDDRLVYQVVRILAESRAPVFVLPGNHDPLTRDSVYLRPSWTAKPGHITLLEHGEPYPVPDISAVLLPVPLRQKKGFHDPTLGLPSWDGDDETIRIGVAHGSLRIAGKYADDDFPIALEAAERAGLDYLALGHWHGTYVHGERTAYSGSHEPTRFDEARSGSALVIEIGARHRLPLKREVATAQLRWDTFAADVTLPRDELLTRARHHVASLHQPDRVLLRLRVEGHAREDAELAVRDLVALCESTVAAVVVQRADTPATELASRLASARESSALVAGILEALASSAVPATDALDARRLLSECLFDVWPSEAPEART